MLVCPDHVVNTTRQLGIQSSKLELKEFLSLVISRSSASCKPSRFAVVDMRQWLEMVSLTVSVYLQDETFDTHCSDASRRQQQEEVPLTSQGCRSKQLQHLHEVDATSLCESDVLNPEPCFAFEQSRVNEP